MAYDLQNEETVKVCDNLMGMLAGEINESSLNLNSSYLPMLRELLEERRSHKFDRFYVPESYKIENDKEDIAKFGDEKTTASKQAQVSERKYDIVYREFRNDFTELLEGIRSSKNYRDKYDKFSSVFPADFEPRDLMRMASVSWKDVLTLFEKRMRSRRGEFNEGKLRIKVRLENVSHSEMQNAIESEKQRVAFLESQAQYEADQVSRQSQSVDISTPYSHSQRASTHLREPAENMLHSETTSRHSGLRLSAAARTSVISSHDGLEVTKISVVYGVRYLVLNSETEAFIPRNGLSEPIHFLREDDKSSSKSKSRNSSRMVGKGLDSEEKISHSHALVQPEFYKPDLEYYDRLTADAVLMSSGEKKNIPLKEKMALENTIQKNDMLQVALKSRHIMTFENPEYKLPEDRIPQISENQTYFDWLKEYNNFLLQRYAALITRRKNIERTGANYPPEKQDEVRGGLERVDEKIQILKDSVNESTLLLNTIADRERAETRSVKYPGRNLGDLPNVSRMDLVDRYYKLLISKSDWSSDWTTEVDPNSFSEPLSPGSQLHYAEKEIPQVIASSNGFFPQKVGEKRAWELFIKSVDSGVMINTEAVFWKYREATQIVDGQSLEDEEEDAGNSKEEDLKIKDEKLAIIPAGSFVWFQEVITEVDSKSEESGKKSEDDDEVAADASATAGAEAAGEEPSDSTGHADAGAEEIDKAPKRKSSFDTKTFVSSASRLIIIADELILGMENANIIPAISHINNFDSPETPVSGMQAARKTTISEKPSSKPFSLEVEHTLPGVGVLPYGTRLQVIECPRFSKYDDTFSKETKVDISAGNYCIDAKLTPIFDEEEEKSRLRNLSKQIEKKINAANGGTREDFSHVEMNLKKENSENNDDSNDSQIPKPFTPLSNLEADVFSKSSCYPALTKPDSAARKKPSLDSSAFPYMHSNIFYTEAQKLDVTHKLEQTLLKRAMNPPNKLVQANAFQEQFYDQTGMKMSVNNGVRNSVEAYISKKFNRFYDPQRSSVFNRPAEDFLAPEYVKLSAAKLQAAFGVFKLKPYGRILDLKSVKEDDNINENSEKINSSEVSRTNTNTKKSSPKAIYVNYSESGARNNFLDLYEVENRESMSDEEKEAENSKQTLTENTKLYPDENATYLRLVDFFEKTINKVTNKSGLEK